MDEARAVFYEDVSEKAITARSSHNVNRNYNRNKYYTRKEIEKLSSETKSVNVNEYISYDEFKNLPATLQTEYLRSLTDKYHVTCSAFARLWGKDPSTLCKIFHNLGIKSYKDGRKNERKFLRDLKPKKENPKADVPDISDFVPVTPPTERKPADVVSVSSEKMLLIDPGIVVDCTQVDTTLKFNTPEAVCQFFMRYIPLGASMHIAFRVEKVAEKIEEPKPVTAVEGGDEVEKCD